MENKSITGGNSDQVTPMGLIMAERMRQIDKLGFTTEKDQAYQNGELFKAACCYSSRPYLNANSFKEDGTPKGWPFSADWWKPSPDNRIKELAKAGALLVAHNQLTGEDKEIKPYLIQVVEELEQMLINPNQEGLFTHCPACHTMVTHTELHKNAGGVCNACIALMN